MNKLLKPEEFNERLRQLAQNDPELLDCLAASDTYHRLINKQAIEEKRTAKKNISRFVYGSSVVFVFLFLKAVGVNVSNDHLFILYTILFSWLLYVA